jgi:hypothetical protein
MFFGSAQKRIDYRVAVRVKGSDKMSFRFVSELPRGNFGFTLTPTQLRFVQQVRCLHSAEFYAIPPFYVSILLDCNREFLLTYL